MSLMFLLFLKAIAMQYALAGADTVVISGRSAGLLEETKSIIQKNAPNCTVLPVPTDVIDEASVQKLFDSLPRTPDILINNAGSSQSQTSIADSDSSIWWSDWVNPDPTHNEIKDIGS